MVIAESNVAFTSSHLSLERYQKTESLKAWVGDARPDFEGKNQAAPAAGRDRVLLSPQAAAEAAPASGEAQGAEGTAETGEANLEPKYLLLKQLVERFLKTRIHLLDAREATGSSAAPQGGEAAAPAAQRPPRAGYGVEYDLTESRYEMESTSFSASGMIKTADGQEVNFNLNLSMTRVYASQTSVSLRAGDAVRKDPLVLNFNGSAAELSSVSFSFDLNADGTNEQVASLGPNSGYLALDKNGDGKVNDGSELFGPRTGNGFSELAAYDTDHNGWIDENDAVFSQLGLWSGGAADQPLSSLRDAGVGAIYLANQATPFDLKSQDNALLGGVKSSGIFLGENGSVGTVQQVDLAV